MREERVREDSSGRGERRTCEGVVRSRIMGSRCMVEV
jgi:hypothetical protein